MVFITSKNGIYACKNVEETCRKHGDMILRYLLIKTAAKFLRTESVKCPARAVIAKARARHAHVMLLNVLTSRKSDLFKYSISQVSYVHSSRTTDESLHSFTSENQKAFARKCRLRLPGSHSRIRFFFAKTL